MANTIKVNGKTISYSTSSITTSEVKFSDGTVLTVVGSVANAAILKAYLAKQTAPVPGVYEPTQPSAELWKKVFDHAYLGSKVLNSSGVQAADGEEVFSFIDQIGKVPVKWAGDINPPRLSKAKPRYHNNLQGFTFFPNESDLRYRSQSLGNYPDVCERWFIGVSSNYRIFEAYFKDGIEYLGDMGNGGLRTRNGSDWAGDDSYISSLGTGMNEICLVRQRFYNKKPDIPLAKGSDVSYLMPMELWVNGVKEPKLMTTFHQTEYIFGASSETNNSHWGLMGMFYKGSPVSDSDASALTAQFMEQYNIGKPLNLPIAENIQIKRSGTTVSASYTFKGVGAAENVSKRKIKWVMVYGGITYAEYIPGTDNLLSFDASKYPLVAKDPNTGKQATYYATQMSVRVEITVEDMQGRTHVIPQSVML